VSGTLAKADVPRVYTATAPVYDLWATLTESRARRRSLELAAIRDGEAILEVAVGTGLLFAEVLARNPSGRNEGIDLTEAMLARARQKAERAATRSWRLRVGDAYRLDFEDGAFDLLLNSYMFDLLPEADFPRVLAEFRRVLRPDGRLVLTNLAPATSLGYRLWEWLYRVRPALVGGCRGVEVAEPLVRAGFHVVTRERVVQLFFPSEVILAVRARTA
jgi:ubiquinone/menaquinone biosynthesis C-methylase UbiE